MFASVGHANIQVLQLSKDVAPWSVSSVDFDAANLQIGAEGAANITRGCIHPSRMALFMALSSYDSRTYTGHPLDERKLLRLHPGAEQVTHVKEPSWWAGYVVCPEAFGRAYLHLVGREVAKATETCRALVPDGLRMGLLRQKLLELRSVLNRQPSLLESHVVRRLIGRDMLEGYVAAVASAHPSGDDTRFTGRREKVLMTALDFIEAHADEPLSVLDVCAATGVSARTLFYIFDRYLGLGPKRYLKVHRMKQVRRSLQRAGPDDNVTSLAAACGFFELGRFAVEYKSLFGESPSDTLRAAWPLSAAPEAASGRLRPPHFTGVERPSEGRGRTGG